MIFYKKETEQKKIELVDRPAEFLRDFFGAGVLSISARPSKSALSLADSLAVSLTGLFLPFLVTGVLAIAALLVTMIGAGDRA